MVPRLHRAGLTLLLVAALVAAVASGPAWGLHAAGGAGTATADIRSPAPAAQETPQPPAVDNTLTRIELAADGSARWTVTIRTRLDDAAAVEEYEAFQDRFRANTSRFLGPFESRIRSVVGAAGSATGREMAATAFAAETRIQEVPRRWGIVTYSFTWEGFARVEGDAVVAGDAFAGGFFLAENDTLTVVAPSGYAVASVEPGPDERSDRAVSWTGRVDFPDGRPLVRAAPAGAADGNGDPAAPLSPSRPVLLGAGALAVAVLVGLAVLARRRRGASAGGAAPATDETLTDEERVVALLEERGGRVPQAAVIEAFDWSTSKTSRVLGRMADAGTIEKLQLGRENLIRLPQEDEDRP